MSGMRDELLERFLRYVRIDTGADETSKTVPSTAAQLVLSKLLAEECRAMGLSQVTLAESGVVTALVPGTVAEAPLTAWIAHVDTSPEYCNTGVNPLVHENYQGDRIPLPGDPRQVLDPEIHPELKTVFGHTLITTDGRTLLGGDDKGGVAVIMTAAKELLQRKSSHAPILLVFTCDEEIGRGTDHIDVPSLGAVCGYTLDGAGQGCIEVETFSADQAVIRVQGTNTHPSIGKGTMVNAIRILSAFIDRLPQAVLAPEVSDDREGFLHPYHLEGGVAEASARLILRDFETIALTRQKEILEAIAVSLRAEYPKAAITIEIHEQYRNMREGLGKEPRAVPKAIEAMKAAGLEPRLGIIRGGTDGSLLTAKGLPCPNLSTGQHNPHSPLEWASLDEMATAVEVLVQLAAQWAMA